MSKPPKPGMIWIDRELATRGLRHMNAELAVIDERRRQLQSDIEAFRSAIRDAKIQEQADKRSVEQVDASKLPLARVGPAYSSLRKQLGECGRIDVMNSIDVLKLAERAYHLARIRSESDEVPRCYVVEALMCEAHFRMAVDQIGRGVGAGAYAPKSINLLGMDYFTLVQNGVELRCVKIDSDEYPKGVVMMLDFSDMKVMPGTVIIENPNRHLIIDIK